MPAVKIALLGDSPTQLLNQAVTGYAYSLGWNAEIWEADFDQIERQILDPDSDLYQQLAEFILLFPSTQKLRTKFYQTKNKVAHRLLKHKQHNGECCAKPFSKNQNQKFC